MVADGRRINGNSAADMQRYGYVVLEYSLAEGAWVGYDVEGNRWRATREDLERALWSYADCEDRWYRVARPEALRIAGARCFPRRNVHDARNHA